MLENLATFKGKRGPMEVAFCTFSIPEGPRMCRDRALAVLGYKKVIMDHGSDAEVHIAV